MDDHGDGVASSAGSVSMGAPEAGVQPVDSLLSGPSGPVTPVTTIGPSRGNGMSRYTRVKSPWNV